MGKLLWRALSGTAVLLVVAAVGPQTCIQIHHRAARERNVRSSLAFAACINHERLKHPAASYQEILETHHRPFGVSLDDDARFHRVPPERQTGELDGVGYVISMDPGTGGLACPVSVYADGRVVNASWQRISWGW